MKVKLNLIEGVEARCFAIGNSEKYVGQWSDKTELSLYIPSGENVIHAAGIELRANKRIMHDVIKIHEIRFDSEADCRIDFRREKVNDYGLDYGEMNFKEINQCTTLKQNCSLDEQGLLVQDDMIIFGNADASMERMEFEAILNHSLEVCFDVKGRLDYQSFVLTTDEIVFESHKMFKKGFTSKQNISKICMDVIVHITVERYEDTLKVYVNDECYSFEAEKSYGALGFRADLGSSARITWCQFVMHEFS